MPTASTLRSLLACLVVLAIPGGAVTQAQEEPPERPARTDDTPERDPFEESDRMRDAAEERDGPKEVEESTGFVPATTERVLPTLKLRGVVRVKGQDTLALIEVLGDETLLVREGDTFGVSGAGSGDPTVFRVKELDRLSAVVEVGTLGRAIVVR